MGLFSRSRSRGHYPDNNRGSGYYKRPHGSGILGRIFDAVLGSGRHSQSYDNHNYPNQPNHPNQPYNNPNYPQNNNGYYPNQNNGQYPNRNNGYYPKKHRSKSSWS